MGKPQKFVLHVNIEENSSHIIKGYFFGWPALYCTDTNSGTASQAAPHERRLGGFFVHPVAPYIFSTGTIARVGRGLDPEARAASGSPGFEPGLVVTFETFGFMKHRCQQYLFQSLKLTWSCCHWLGHMQSIMIQKVCANLNSSNKFVPPICSAWQIFLKPWKCN